MASVLAVCWMVSTTCAAMSSLAAISIFAVDFGLAFLATEAFDLGHSHAGDADAAQRFADLIELEWFDYGYDELHLCPLMLTGHFPAVQVQQKPCQAG